MKSFFLVALLLLSSLSLMGRPAYPGLLYATLEDGSRVSYRIIGDEHRHAFQTTDGRFIERLCELDETVPEEVNLWRYVEAPAFLSEEEPIEGQVMRRPAQVENRYTDFPTIGEMHGLVLLVEYQDVAFQPEYDQALFDRQLNEENYSDYEATGSARDYFIDQSLGQFRPTFDVIGPIKLPHKRSYYGANRFGEDVRPAEMIRDACEIAHDSLGINFANYDYDNDEYVDFVFCIYAGYGENYGAVSSTIWPHMWWLSAGRIDCVLDEKTVDMYACTCELKNAYGHELDGIGALCHEFGHVLGLPDLYNTTNQSKVQLGTWDVMDTGSYNNDSRTPPSYTSFERHQVGWLDFIDLTEPEETVIVPEYTESNVAYRIFTNASEDEFFTLENHQQTGWDAYHAGSGLMIIHVDYSEKAWENNTVNSGKNHHYDLMEADGSASKHKDTDLYPIEGNTVFTDYSTPNAQSWSGIPTERPVTDITQHEDGTISFAFMHDNGGGTTVSFEQKTTATETLHDLFGNRITESVQNLANGLYISGSKMILIQQ